MQTYVRYVDKGIRGGILNAPSHYRQTLNRIYRAKSKQALFNIGSKEDYFLPKFTKSMNWDWF